jgi:hypothetical protein
MTRARHGHRLRRGHCHSARLRGKGECRRDHRTNQIPPNTRNSPHAGKLGFFDASFNAHSATGGGRPARAGTSRDMALLRVAPNLSRI